MCLDMICRRAAPAPGPGDAKDAGAIKTRSELGESCQTRADCLPPLACIENTCLIGLVDAGSEVAPTHGKRGETCQASNDCDKGLSCISGRCLESDFDLDFIPKQCYRVQCAASADCCKDFKPLSGYTLEQCDTMKRNCEGAASYPPPAVMPPAVTPNDCVYWASYCRCSLDCLEEKCVMVPGQYCLVDGQCTTGPASCVNNRCVECTANDDCLTTLRPFCTKNECVQCKADGDCTTPGSRCVSGTCMPGCTANEHCGLMQKCEAGECIDAGCTSDRQCYFLTGDDRSRCVAKKCQTPCATDAECTGDFHICANGVCAFAGCDNDEECRAVLKLENQAAMSLDRAVCRAPVAP